jgi:hypothetical protein
VKLSAVATAEDSTKATAPLFRWRVRHSGYRPHNRGRGIRCRGIGCLRVSVVFIVAIGVRIVGLGGHLLGDVLSLDSAGATDSISDFHGSIFCRILGVVRLRRYFAGLILCLGGLIGFGLLVGLRFSLARFFGGDLVGCLLGLSSVFDGGLVYLRRSFLRLDRVLTLDSSDAADRFGLVLVGLGFSLVSPVRFFGGDLVGYLLGFGSVFDGSLMHLQRSFLRLNGILTLDNAHTTDRRSVVLSLSFFIRRGSREQFG